MNIFKSQTDKIKLFFAGQYSKSIPSEKIVGVIGEHGKTTTVLASEAVLSRKFKKIVSFSNLNLKSPSLYSLADVSTAILKGSSAEKIILELPSFFDPTSKEFSKLINLSTVVITSSRGVKENRVETSRFVQFAERVLEKLPSQGLAVINWEDSNLRNLGDNSQATCIYFGMDPKNCHIWAGNIKTVNYETVFELNYGVERVEVRSQLLGLNNVMSMLASAALGVIFGLPLTSIKKSLESLTPLPGRMNIMEGHGGSLIIDDTHTSDPSSWDDALSVTSQLSARRRIVVIGEMKDLDENSNRLHQMLAQRVYTERLDIVLAGTGKAELVAEELKKLGFLEDRIESGMGNPAIVSRLLKLLGRGDLVLIKGNRGARYDEIIKKIQLKK